MYRRLNYTRLRVISRSFLLINELIDILGLKFLEL